MQQTNPPPIQWLPVFEAAARHLSFKKAAEELCVTPPAVSQQIKVLEDYMGMVLFDRSGRRLRLTKAGEYYYKVASNVIKLHGKGYRDFVRAYQSPVLQISSPLFIAQELLIPNYMAFRELAPSIELRIITGRDYVDFDNENIDAAVRFGDGPWPGLECRLLCEVNLKLVCSQRYLNDQGIDKDEPLSAADVENQVLISLYDNIRDWTVLFPGVNPSQKIVCDSYLSAIKSAEEGFGIAVGLTPVINHLINSERLVALKTETLYTDYAYWLVAPKESESQEQIDLFYPWIKSLFEQLK